MLTLRRAAAGIVVLAACALPLTSAAATPGAPTSEVVGGPELASPGLVVHLGAGATPLPVIDADTWLLADLTTGEVLAAKGAHTRVLPASTLKTLTAATLMPLLDPAKVVTATRFEAGQVGSKVGLVTGATYTVTDLWNALLLPSANDAAMALADANGGPVPTVAQMAEKARSIGALDTTPKTPSGLDTPGQLTSAYDMALIARAAMALPQFRTVTQTKSYAFPGKPAAAGKPRPTYRIYTENRLLRHSFPGTVGGKTGFTSLAHRTFWGAAARDGHTLVVTLFQIHQPTETAARALLTWGFANRTHVTPVGTLVDPASATALPSPDASVGAGVGATASTTAAGGVSGLGGSTAVSLGRGLATWILPVVALMALVGVLAWWWLRRTPRSGTHVNAAAAPTPAAAARTFEPEPAVAASAKPAAADAGTPDRGTADVDDTAPVPVVPAPGGNVRIVRPPSGS